MDRRRIAILAVPLLALSVVAGKSLATSADGPACHHGIDADRGKLAGVSDPTKKSQAYGHLKAAYQDELASNFTGCLDELKAAEALMQ
jgi:hypothetical protein